MIILHNHSLKLMSELIRSFKINVMNNLRNIKNQPLDILKSIEYKIFLTYAIQDLLIKGVNYSQIIVQLQQTIDKMLLEVKESKTKGRGMYAKENIPRGKVLLEAPQSSYITYSLFSEHPCFELIHSSCNERLVQFGMFLASVEHMDQKEQWFRQVKEYQKKLPKYYNNLVAWSNCQLDYLNNKTLIQQVKSKRQRFRAAYEEIMQNLKQQLEKIKLKNTLFKNSQIKTIKRGTRSYKPKNETSINQQQQRYLLILQRIKFEDVIKYICAVESRNAYYQDQYDGDSQVGALVPDLELFNHSKYSKCSVNRGYQCYRVVADVNIKKGEEVCVTYGKFSTQKFLNFYGMIPIEKQQQQNILEHDCIVDQKVASETSINRQRKKLAEQYNSQWKASEKTIQGLRAVQSEHLLI